MTDARVRSADIPVACAGCGRRNRVPAAGTGAVRCGGCHEPLAWIAEADDDTFAEVAEDASVPVLVHLWAARCGPCLRVGPVLDRLAREMAGRVKLVRVDIARAPKTKVRFGAQAVPTLLLMRSGRVVDRRTGAAPADDLRAWTERGLARPVC